jgi:hypothetical protein
MAQERAPLICGIDAYVGAELIREKVGVGESGIVNCGS